MKKGFTLIELLAVIVILAIIALIATPIVLNIINDAKRSSTLRSAEFYLDGVEYAISKRRLNGKGINDGIYTILPDGNICIGTVENNNCIGDILEIEVDGEKPNGDKIKIQNGKIVSHIVSYGNAVVKSENETEGDDGNLNIGGGAADTPAELTTLTSKTWNGLTNFDGKYVWTDGTNTYYSEDEKQYVLNGDTWSPKIWNGLTNFKGYNVWTDGSNIYYSVYNAVDYSIYEHYVLNGDTWIPKVWNNFVNFDGNDIWTDGENIYWSNLSRQYILNGDTWTPKTWDGYAPTSGGCIWTDGENIYCAGYASYKNLILNGDKWDEKIWYGLEYHSAGVWSDGYYIYFSNGSKQYVLNGDTWTPKTWNGNNFWFGSCVWTDGVNYYYSQGPNQYIFS